MSDFINKHFRKGKCVKVIYYNEADRRQRERYVIPVDNIVTVDSKTYVLSDEFVYYDKKRFPTYTLNSNSAFPVFKPLEPMQEAMKDANGKELSARRFNIAINTNAARQIYQNFEKSMDKMTYVLILQGIVILGLVIGFYFIYQELNAVKVVVEAIRLFVGV
ncbi:MAG: hypothetical protein AB7V16_13225 [Vulcanibacillus sp.]